MLRAGVITASEVAALVKQDFTPRTGDGVKTYLYRKASERLMGYQMGAGSTFAMDMGTLLETQAVPWFEFAHNTTVQKVGFITSDDGVIGCSPDGLLGEDGGLEIKCPQTPAHIEYLLSGRVPVEYLPQIHMSMLVTGRKHWTFISYNSYLPKLVVRVERDEAIQTALQAALTRFTADLESAVSRVRAIIEDQSKPAPMQRAS